MFCIIKCTVPLDFISRIIQRNDLGIIFFGTTSVDSNLPQRDVLAACFLILTEK